MLARYPQAVPGGMMETALSILMEGLIDYAGLYPPASLGMDTATRNYAAYRKGHQAEWLGRFVLPVARLKEFSAARATLPAGTWKLAALIGTDPVLDLSQLAEFNRAGFLYAEPAARIDTLEMKADRPSDIARVLEAAPDDVIAYFEIPLADPGHCLAELARLGGRAKLRTGGVTPDRIPSSAEAAAFVAACAAARVPLKATAGLHHPFRSLRPLTYAPDSPKAMMHGFVNVFLAAAFATQGAPAAELEALLDETSPQAFRFTSDGVQWRNRRIDAESLRRARGDFAIAFGSCSFEEPRQDLREAGWL